ncbi:MAG: non-canonical purine NTP pyrophosphatase, partial [Verrucomicrobiota bacterium]|nr:non-canonical purine NTP pyrophosphatase [Verrucomicrobiota bacterium]
MSKLVLATRNAHKVEELRLLLGDEFKVQDLGDFPSAPVLPESANSFAGNATLKALTLAQWIGASLELNDAAQYVVADDSGLEVDALGGAPGVHSARYASLDDNNSSDID